MDLVYLLLYLKVILCAGRDDLCFLFLSGRGLKIFQRVWRVRDLIHQDDGKEQERVRICVWSCPQPQEGLEIVSTTFSSSCFDHVPCRSSSLCF